MISRSKVAAFATLAALAGAPAAAQSLSQLSAYSASGTHTCGEGTGARTCIVTGLSFSNCIDATSVLKLQDCCRTACLRDARTGDRRCEDGKSVAFHLNYCIGGR